MATRTMGAQGSAPSPKRPAPFWLRLNTFFLFPLQSKPLMYSLLLAFSSMLYEAIFFLPDALAILLVEIGIVLAASRYAFKITALGSRGIYNADDYPSELDPEWKNLPWKLFAILIAQSFAVGWLQRLSPTLGMLAWLAMCFLLPATQIVLVQTCSFSETLNPANAWNAVRTIGWPYLLLCLFLFLLSQGIFIALGMLLPVFSGWVLLPIVNWVLIYFSWVMASLLGYAMYQNHEAFGIALLPGAGLDEDAPPVDRRSPRRIEQDALDAQVAELITAGDVAGALGVAYEEQRTRGEEVPAQRRYHRVLALAEGKTTTLLEHAHRYIPLLLQSGHGSEALTAWQTCRARDPQFELRDATATLHLAKAAWYANDAKEALALLQGFDRRFLDHESVPAAYELVARVLLQGMNRADMALRVLATLESRYPDALATQETQWLLRNHVPQKAPPVQE
jgi:hypothetical protein